MGGGRFLAVACYTGLMMIMLHIGIALASIVLGTIGVIMPTKRLLRTNYLLIVATVISGCALLVIQPQQLGHVCISGLVYLCVASVLMAVSRRRLQHSAIMTTTE